MKKLFMLFLLLIAVDSYSQELGSIVKKEHYIKLIKSSADYSLIYTEGNSDTVSENIFVFSDIQSIYSTIIEGFEDSDDHQIIIRANSDTIVKFEYRQLKGEQQLKIRQNNLTTKTFGESTFFTKDEILKLFGSP